MTIKIFGRPNCASCESAKAFLERRKVNYLYIDVLDLPPQNRMRVIEESGMQSFPIVKVGDIYIGGYNQLEAYINGKENN